MRKPSKLLKQSANPFDEACLNVLKLEEAYEKLIATLESAAHDIVYYQGTLKVHGASNAETLYKRKAREFRELFE